MKKDKDTSFDKTGADVIQHLLELSEAGGASNGQKLAQPGTQDVKSVQQVVDKFLSKLFTELFQYTVNSLFTELFQYTVNSLFMPPP